MSRLSLPTVESDMRHHAGTLAFYPFLLLLLAVLVEHPLYLILLLFVTTAALILRGSLSAFGKTLRFGWAFLLVFFVLSVLINKNGATVLYAGGLNFPVFGKIRLTAESIAYQGMMLLRLLVIFGASTLYVTSLSPDRGFSLFSSFAGRSSVVAMLTTRLISYLSEQTDAVRDVMRTRGVKFEEGSWIKRLQKRNPLLNVLLVSAMEGSWQVAEAMEARGYGMGRRTAYTRERWTGRDGLVWLPMVAALFLAIGEKMSERIDYAFYPRLGPLWPDGGEALAALPVLAVLLLLPAFLLRRRRRNR